MASDKRIEGEFHYAELIDGGHWRIARKPDDKPVERVIPEHTAEDAVRHYDEQANHFRKQALSEIGEALEALDDECCGEINLHHTNVRGWEINSAPVFTGFHATPTAAIFNAAKPLTGKEPND